MASFEALDGKLRGARWQASTRSMVSFEALEDKLRRLRG